MTTTWGPIVYPVALDSFAPALIDNVDEVIANHPNSLATAIRAVETKLGITNAPVTGLGGVSFDPAGKAANPGAVGAPTIWADNSGGPGFTLYYTDDLGSTYSLQAGGVTIQDWAPGTVYTVDQEVMYVGLRFRCIAGHTSSGTFFNDTDLSKWTCVSGEGLIVNQVAHGFSELDVIYSNAGVWTAAQANAAGTLSTPPMLVIGVGTAVNYFLAAQDQIVTVSLHGLVVDDVYYLSAAAAGTLTNTEPTGAGNYSNPICRVLSANTLAILPNRPILATATVTPTLDIAYDAGASGAGRAITGDSGAVTITVPDTSNNAGLEIIQNDVTNDPVAMTVTNAGDGSCLVISNAGSGASIDLQGVGSRKISSTSANLTVETVTSGNIYLDSVDDIYIRANDNAGNFEIQGDNTLYLIGVNTLGLYGTNISVQPYQDTTGTFFGIDSTGAGLSSLAGTDIWVQLKGTISQGGTAGYTILELDTDENTTGSGTKLLLDAKYEGASKFTVDTAGDIEANLATFAGIESVGYIDLDTTATPGFQTGRIAWNDTTKTVDIDLQGTQVTLQVGQEGHAYVRNTTGSTIYNGDAVYASGASGNKILISLADNTDADKIQVFGLATEDIAHNANGYVALWGVVRGTATQPINTSGFLEGDKLYLDTAGGWTNVHPSLSTAATIVLGVVRRSHASEGEIHIKIFPFTIGNNFDGTMRQGIINKSTGVSAAVGFTAVNDQNHWMTVGIGGSNNAVFGEAAIFYGPGYADNWYAVDGNKSHKWYVDPTDSHNNSSLSYLSMELQPDGDLVLSRGQYVSTLVTGTAPLNVTSTTLNTNLNADLLDGQHGSYYEIAPDIQVHGFVDLAETSIGFNDGTYTFTLTDAGGGWSYYRQGIKYTISGNKTTTLPGSPPATGLYFIYIDATDGTLSNSTTPWDLTGSKVPVAALRWNDTLTPKYILGEERHTTAMNQGTHDYQHHTFGTRLDSSGAISGYVINSDVDGNKQFDIAQSEIWDEDLHSTLAATTGGVDDYHIAYRTGVSTWVWKQDAMPFDYTPAGYINYDNAGTMTQGANNKFYTTYLIATNHSGLARYVTIHGQSEFDTLIAARDELFSDLTLTNLGIIEGIAIWKFIWESSSSYVSTGKCRLAVDPIPIDTNVNTASAPPGLGTMSTQDADNVAIIGGTITGLTSFDVGGTVTLVGTLDDDTMGTATDTTLATSESIKAYVDTSVGAVSTDIISEGDSSVEVIDAGTGEIRFSVDGSEEFAMIDGRMYQNNLPLINQSTANRSYALMLANDQSAPNYVGIAVQCGNGGSTLNLYGCGTGGTLASRTTVADTEILGLVAANGWYSTTYQPGAQIIFRVDGTPSGLVPTKMEFRTTDSSNNTVTRYEIMADADHIWYGSGAAPTQLFKLDETNLYAITTSRAGEPGAVNGAFFYDTSANLWKFGENSAWVTFASGGGGVSLDGAYNNGSAITVDAAAITLTVPDTTNTYALGIAQNDVTNNPACLVIANAGSGASVYLAGAGTREILSDTGNLSIRTSTSGSITLTTGGNDDITFSPGGSGYIKNTKDYFTDYILSSVTNTFFGYGTAPVGLSHTAGNEGWRNSLFGYNAGSSITTGFGNTCFGYNSGSGITDGAGNLTFGSSTGSAIGSADYNVIMGESAGVEQAQNYGVYIGVLAGQYANGASNVGVGYAALRGVTGTTTGSSNTAIGMFAGNALTTGSYNVFLGRDAGSLVTEGARNVCIGYQAGDNLTTGDYSVIIGATVDPDSATNDYQLNIANVIKCSNWNLNGDIVLQPNGTGIVKTGSGSSTYLTASSGDLLVPGELEVSNTSYFASSVYYYASNVYANDVSIILGTANDSVFRFDTGQTSPCNLFGLDDVSNLFLITTFANRTFNHAHAAFDDPTVVIHSATQSTSQWRSITHDKTDAVDGIGTGSKVTEHEAPVSLADDASFDLPSASAGYGFFMVDDGEEYGQIVWKTDGTVQLVAHSTNVDDADTDGYFCFFDNGTAVRVRNRLGAAKTVTFDYHYTTSP